jgi:predicted polyphosphate/ATP-dependent NAD kinase
MIKIGFIVNPIAGMGGRVGLKGTDDVLKEAKKRGAVPIAAEKSMRTIKELMTSQNLAYVRKKKIEVNWFTCSGDMGARVLENAGIPPTDFRIIYTPQSDDTTANDTKEACKKFLEEEVELILFCGGDGTARDIYSIVDDKIPMLGIPSGVKMHSGVFGVTPEATARILSEYLDGELTFAEVEIMDLNETAYRRGEWNLKLFGTVRTPFEPNFIQGSKMMMDSASDDEIKEEIGAYIVEEMDEAPGVLFILGPGSTMATVGEALKLETTLLGVDAVKNKKLAGKDLNEQALLELLDKTPDARLLVSPIGNQGFVLGRGNHQFSPQVIRRVGLDNIWILTTPAKLGRTPVLRVDTGDVELDREMAEHQSYRIIIGYRLMRREGLVKEKQSN